jgi:hypothetical protein
VATGIRSCHISSHPWFVGYTDLAKEANRSLALKDNQPNLSAEVERMFEAV